MNDKYVKILFELEQDKDGWPPAKIESLWAIDLGDNKYKIDSIPFYAWNVACDDIVYAELGNDNMLYCKYIVQKSSNSTVRIIIHNNDKKDYICNELSSLNCEWEGAGQQIGSLVSINIPKEINYKNIRIFLENNTKLGNIGCEESSISDHHKKQIK